MKKVGNFVRVGEKREKSQTRKSGDFLISAKVPKGFFCIYRRVSKNLGEKPDPERSTQETIKDPLSGKQFVSTRDRRNAYPWVECF